MSALRLLAALGSIADSIAMFQRTSVTKLVKPTSLSTLFYFEKVVGSMMCIN